MFPFSSITTTAEWIQLLVVIPHIALDVTESMRRNSHACKSCKCHVLCEIRYVPNQTTCARDKRNLSLPGCVGVNDRQKKKKKNRTGESESNVHSSLKQTCRKILCTLPLGFQRTIFRRSCLMKMKLECSVVRTVLMKGVSTCTGCKFVSLFPLHCLFCRQVDTKFHKWIEGSFSFIKHKSNCFFVCLPFSH
jgi:hypothetical protein